LYERQGRPGPVASAASVRKMLDVMAATVEDGTARAQDRSPGVMARPAPARISAMRFIGLTATFATGVWVGNDDNAPMD
jgi:membrane peptidoglycan carboxypeptidase